MFRRSHTRTILMWGVYLMWGFYLSLAIPGLFALNPHKTLAQYRRTVWTQAQGIPQDYVNSIAQTTDGYLWMSTDEGLSRFDGYDFTNFTADAGNLPTNAVRALAAGREGTLWIGTRDGLTRYYKGRFTTFTTKDGLPDNFISAILEDHNGVLWIASGAYLSRFENGKFTTYSVDRMLPVQGARTIYEDSQHTLWIAGVGGVVKLVDGSFVPVLGPKEMEGLIVDAFVADHSGNLWIGGSRGIILRAPDGKLTRFDTSRGLPDNLVLALWSDRDGNLWAGTNNGLSRFEGDRFVAYDVAAENSRDTVRSLFEDREGDLWVGMKSGLNRLHDDPFTVFTRSEGFPNEVPVTIRQDRMGTTWIGYHGSGVVAIHDGKLRGYTTDDGLGSNEIYAVQETRNGDLLVSTRAGLSWMHAGRFSNYTIPDPLGRTVIFDVLEDRQGRIWAAGRGGVFEMNNNKFRVVLPGGPLIYEPAAVLSNGLNGSIWAGVFGEGLWQIQNGKTTHFGVAEGLGSNAVRSLYLDPDGILWIGTFGGGLNAFHDGVFKRYTTKNGLLSNNISHIEDDGQGSLWLSTTRGICRVTKQQLRDLSSGRVRVITPVNYGVEDGLPSGDVAPGYPGGGGGTKTGDGRLWFPTARGIAVIDPNAEEAQAPPPLIVGFPEITVDGRDIDVNRAGKLKPGPGHIQFRYAAIHLSGPERVRYEYKLDGLDPDWIPAATRRVADYTRLEHGHYRFLVRASVPGQPPSEASFSLEVLPHFYERQLFLWLCAALLLAAIYGLYKLQLRQIRLRFSLVLDERARLAREIHDTLSQGFVGISSQLNAVATRIRAHQCIADENLKVADQHLELARKMVRHSLTEAKRSVMDLRASVLDERNLPSALAVAATQWTAGSDTTIDVEVSGAGRAFPQDLEQNILRIAQEAVTNAIKHGAAMKVSILLAMEARKLVLVVKDDGRGFDCSGIFSSPEGHFGLQGMRERAEHLGGELILSSQPGQGTQIKVSIPTPQSRTDKSLQRRLLSAALLRMRQRSESL
jgi:signal transduction histidine kinase/ligand-binding sensor domain-containing protein